MKVQIWSDVMCPFCFIGKRNFESALAQFPHRDQVEVEWKSFELDPAAPRNSMANMANTLAAKYKKSLPEAQAMMAQVAITAKRAGLEFNLNQAIPTNSLDAHRLIHLAARHDKQDAAEELLFMAYLIQGQDLGKSETLVKIGADIGLPAADVDRIVKTSELTGEVRSDENEAYQLEIRGVPFFLIDT